MEQVQKSNIFTVCFYSKGGRFGGLFYVHWSKSTDYQTNLTMTFDFDFDNIFILKRVGKNYADLVNYIIYD